MWGSHLRYSFHFSIETFFKFSSWSTKCRNLLVSCFISVADCLLEVSSHYLSFSIPLLSLLSLFPIYAPSGSGDDQVCIGCAVRSRALLHLRDDQFRKWSIWQDKPQHHASYASQRPQTSSGWLVPLMEAGTFPKQISVAGNTVFWVEFAVTSWMEGQMASTWPRQVGDLNTNRTFWAGYSSVLQLFCAMGELSDCPPLQMLHIDFLRQMELSQELVDVFVLCEVCGGIFADDFEKLFWVLCRGSSSIKSIKAISSFVISLQV